MMTVRFFLFFLMISISTCWADATTEYTWDQLDQPFLQTIKIPLYGQASLDVDIPAEYCQKNSSITFRMVIDTPFRIQEDTF